MEAERKAAEKRAKMEKTVEKKKKKDDDEAF